jgi:hypothetical protein
MKKFIIIGFAAASFLGQYAGAEAVQNHQASAHHQTFSQDNSSSGLVDVQSGGRATLFNDSDGG